MLMMTQNNNKTCLQLQNSRHADDDTDTIYADDDTKLMLATLDAKFMLMIMQTQSMPLISDDTGVHKIHAALMVIVDTDAKFMPMIANTDAKCMLMMIVDAEKIHAAADTDKIHDDDDADEKFIQIHTWYNLNCVCSCMLA